eukprot:scaffold105230_cov33-Prasinocladus_malaysianus.AAC.1
MDCVPNLEPTTVKRPQSAKPKANQSALPYSDNTPKTATSSIKQSPGSRGRTEQEANAAVQAKDESEDDIMAAVSLALSRDRELETDLAALRPRMHDSDEGDSHSSSDDHEGGDGHGDSDGDRDKGT